MCTLLPDPDSSLHKIVPSSAIANKFVITNHASYEFLVGIEVFHHPLPPIFADTHDIYMYHSIGSKFLLTHVVISRMKGIKVRQNMLVIPCSITIFPSKYIFKHHTLKIKSTQI